MKLDGLPYFLTTLYNKYSIHLFGLCYINVQVIPHVAPCTLNTNEVITNDFNL